MDVVLFNPAPRSGWQVQRRVELPLGLLSTATPLDREGYRVQIVDAFADKHWRRTLRAAMKDRPICFGVTCMTGPQILHALEGCRMMRDRHPDVPIIWGGVHASLLPEQTLEHPHADIVVVGEGEQTFPELVKALEAGTPLKQIAGLCFKEDGRAIRSERRPFVDLNQQPPLSYHLVDMKRYRRRLFGLDHVSLNTSRGCVFRCGFCWDPIMHRRKWRAMSPETILEQIKRLMRDYGIRGFLFTDDNFFVDEKRVWELLEAIVRQNLDIAISKLQIRPDRICRMDPKIFELMVRAGVKRIMVGVESGSQRVLDLIRKNISVAQVIEANDRLIPHSITPLYLFMMGLPTETPDELAQSVRLAVRLTDENPRAVKTFNIYTPYPGTDLYDLCLRLGLRQPQRLPDWASFNFRNIPPESAWISPKMKQLVTSMDFPLMFLGKRGLIKPFRKTNPLVVGLSKLYYPIARYRVTHFDARFPIETKLVRALGLFGRQG